MNLVELTGRLTRDPNVRYTASGFAVGRFNLAVDRQRASKDGDYQTDFIDLICFGKTAELLEKYVRKGRLIAVAGCIQTGYYEKDNKKIYTTDIVANRIEFLGRNPEEASAKPDPAPVHIEPAASAEERSALEEAASEKPETEIPEGFERLADDDIPF